MPMKVDAYRDSLTKVRTETIIFAPSVKELVESYDYPSDCGISEFGARILTPTSLIFSDRKI